MAVKSKVGKQNVEFSTFNIRQRTALQMYTVILGMYLLYYKSVRSS